MEEIKLISDTNGIRIDAWICEKLNKYSRSYIQKLVDEGQVIVNSTIVKSSYKIKSGDEIIINIPDVQMLDILPEKIDIPILYQDDDIIVINKPKGIVVHPAQGNFTGTLVNAILYHCKDSLSSINGVLRPGIVHRIDKDTSGVLVVAKNNIAHEKLSQKFKVHDIKRMYIAIVDGVINEDCGEIDAPIGRHPNDRKKMSVKLNGGRRAVTHFKVIQRFSNKTLVELTLETGRTHQIRVHMAYIKHPVMGDEVYGKKDKKYITNGQTLHAKLLGFVHPIKNRYMEFESDLPGYFKTILEDLKKG